MATIVKFLLWVASAITLALSESLDCQCVYKTPNKEPVKTGLGRYGVFNALLDCTFPAECDVQFLKQFAQQLDNMKGCTMFYPFKEVGANRIYIIFGCDSVIAFEEAMAKKDSRFTCGITIVMDYIDFAMITLGVELNQTQIDGIMPRATLQCETLIAIFRELKYPPGISHEAIIKSWKEHASRPIYYKAATGPKESNYEAFHVAGQEAEWIFRVWDSTAHLDEDFIGGGTLQKQVTSGISHTAVPLIHLDCLCNAS